MKTGDLFAVLREEWPVLKAAPWSIGSLLAAGLTAGFGIGCLYYGGTVSTLRERLQLYQDKLQVASPDDAAKKLNQLQLTIDRLESERKRERHLSEQEKSNLKTAFKDVVAALPAFSVAGLHDPESLQYAKEFMEVFDDAGAKVKNKADKGMFPLSVDVLSPSEIGIFVGVSNKIKPPQSAILFAETLKKAGFDAKFEDAFNLYDDFEFVVGFK